MKNLRTYGIQIKGSDTKHILITKAGGSLEYLIQYLRTVRDVTATEYPASDMEGFRRLQEAYELVIMNIEK